MGEYIQQRYEDLDISSHAELAERVGVSRQTLSNWMNSSTKITLENLIRLAKALNVHPVSLLRVATQEFISYPVVSHPKKRFDDAGFVDETIPDDSLIGSGTEFEKIWWIQNTGSSVWEGRRLVCQDTHLPLYERRGDEFVPFHSCVLTPEAKQIAIPPTKPQETIELKIKFSAPLLPGRAVSIWKITDKDGNHCYPNKPGVWCQVIVTGFY